MAESEKRGVRAVPQAFAQAFPELKDAVVEYEVSSRNLAGTETPHSRLAMWASGGTFQGQIRCTHPECHGGGFEVERIVDDMVKEREESREGVLVCPGWIGDRDRVPCVNSMKYTVALFYKIRTTPQAPLD